ncbi:phosphate signaling complex protein PhoU [Inconstantimicrobium mannanitabidum]|uniref:Phosphate transport system regulatory protein PhoU n=1 Tax=Inconstantimicrobium mannanitabidum TaxID=1604901 RepID=A0ACB5RBI2_9CLOT|nr:phosphate signaling complex protein PhoU [Clostridium sp. TW13]GKX66592.1 phosphate transport system regulatory protein PhoU [Clostridium sp. TW13]
MSRIVFDKKLGYVHEDLVKMGSMVEKQLHSCIDALKNHDVELANKVIDNDDIVDDLQRQIEEKSIRLIAQNQPLATDLRDIFTAIKIVTDLERMADHAVDIAKIVTKMGKEHYIKELIDIPKMAEKVQEMIKLSIDAYIAGDVKAAYDICLKDDEIDAYYKKIFDELLEHMKSNENLNQVSQLLFVCKYLERVADHTTNICEWTIFLVTGKYVDLNE